MAHKTIKTKQKHNTICVGHHYKQTNRNNLYTLHILLTTYSTAADPWRILHSSHEDKGYDLGLRRWLILGEYCTHQNKGQDLGFRRWLILWEYCTHQNKGCDFGMQRVVDPWRILHPSHEDKGWDVGFRRLLILGEYCIHQNKGQDLGFKVWLS